MKANDCFSKNKLITATGLETGNNDKNLSRYRRVQIASFPQSVTLTEPVDAVQLRPTIIITIIAIPSGNALGCSPGHER